MPCYYYAKLHRLAPFGNLTDLNASQCFSGPTLATQSIILYTYMYFLNFLMTSVSSLDTTLSLVPSESMMLAYSAVDSVTVWTWLKAQEHYT